MISITLKRVFKERFKWFLRQIFDKTQGLGFDILPRHYYSSIPDFRDLRSSDLWMEPLSMIGVNGTDLDAQMAFANKICTPFRERIKDGLWSYFCEVAHEVGYGMIEADFLFCFVASMRPARIVQIGCGVSTAVMLGAAAEVGYQPKIVCIEPYPSYWLREMDAAGSLQLIASKAQEIELGVMTALGGGDLLFVDSTHTVKVGSEVNRIILEVLPRLPTGSWVHFHDINFPFDYPRSLFRTLFFPVEGSLLHAFLIGNSRYSIRLYMSMLHYAKSGDLRGLFPNYHPQKNRQGLMLSSEGQFPSAIYLQVC